MSQAALIRALEQKVEEELDRLRTQMQEDCARAERELEQQLAAELAGERLRRSRETEEQCRALLRSAREAAVRTREQARTRLLEKVWSMARARLSELRLHEGEELFSRLAAELPAGPVWKQIRVHPDNVADARRLFPAATIVADGGVTGGLIAVADEPPLQVDNSLETRLRRSWPEFSAALLAELEEHAPRMASSAG